MSKETRYLLCARVMEIDRRDETRSDNKELNRDGVMKRKEE